MAENLLQEKTINQIPIRYTRNPAGALQEVQSPYFQQKALTYDKEGKLTELQWISPSESKKITYSYNSLNQLTSETGIANHTYQYDSLHNRKAKDEDIYEINSLNQITKTNRNQYVFDLNGNRIKKISDHFEIRYEYDALDRLIKVITPDVVVCYYYDSFDRRIAKMVHSQGEITHLNFLYDGQNEIGMVNEQNLIKELRILGHTNSAERGSAIAIEIDQQIYIPLYDLFGSFKLLTSLFKDPVEVYQQDAYGVEAPSQYISPWRFASKRVDPETELIYFGRRYYDPEIGRWITKDPKGYADGIINLYAYVLNNPLNTMDLYGLESLFMKGMKKGFEIEYGRIDVGHSLEFHLTYMEPILRKPLGERKYDNFEQDIATHFGIRNFSRSEVFSRNPDSHTFNILVNGINTSYEGALSNAKYFASLTKKKLNIIMMYNSTHSFSKDVMEARMNQYEVITTPSYCLKDEMESILSKNRKNEINLFPFSQGGIIGSHTLHLMDSKERERIRSFAFAPARIVVPELASVSRNIASKRDFVPFTDFKNRGNLKYLERLEPHKDAKLFDHEFQSPTFRRRIKEYIEMYN